MKIEQDNMMYNKAKKPHNKVATIVSILIIVTILIVVAIVVLMFQMKKAELIVNVDGINVAYTDDTFLFVEGTGELYVSIKDVASLVGYEAHNGEYKVNSEDINKMYVEAKDGTETTSFYLNSTTISKVPPDTSEEYENIEISEPVISVDGKLYINDEGFMKAFNSIISYNLNENRIIIQTLPYLVKYYNANISNYGYSKLSADFNNQKALIYGMLVASKETTEKYGVVDVRTNKEIISPRYNDIQFIEASKEFIITNSSDKVGIAYSTGETKIQVMYDEIKMIDKDLGYYLVKSHSKYGIINDKEKSIIHIEYDNIGIDVSKFPSDEIKNQYILYDTVIPVYLNEKWGLFNINGDKIAEVEYDSIGSINADITDKVVNNAIIVGDSETIIMAKDGLYGGISTRGDVLLPFRFEYIYSITSEGKTTYYIVLNGTSYPAMEVIDAMKKRLGYYDEENSNDVSGDDSQGTQNDDNNQENTNMTTDNNNVTNDVNVQDTNTNNQVDENNIENSIQSNI